MNGRWPPSSLVLPRCRLAAVQTLPVLWPMWIHGRSLGCHGAAVPGERQPVTCFVDNEILCWPWLPNLLMHIHIYSGFPGDQCRWEKRMLSVPRSPRPRALSWSVKLPEDNHYPSFEKDLPVSEHSMNGIM